MDRLGCWQLLGPRRTSRASTHFTPLPPSLRPFLRLFSLVPQNCYAKPSRQRWGSSFEPSRRDAGLISGLSHHLGHAAHLWNTQPGIWSGSFSTFVPGKSDPGVDLFKVPWEMVTPDWSPKPSFCCYGNKTIKAFTCKVLMLCLISVLEGFGS